MKSLTGIALVVVMASTSISAGAADEYLKRLSGDQIRAKLAGKEHTDEVHWRDVYERDCALRHYAMGRKLLGKWSVRNNTLCVDLPDPEGGCFEVWTAGNRIQMRPTGLSSSLDGILQAPNDAR
jgi:hypothetical protein